MIVGVPKESFPGERRVALVPSVIPSLAKAGFEVVVESGAGAGAGYPDPDYVGKGGKILRERAEVFKAADVVLQVLCHGSNDATGKDDLPLLRPGQVLIGFLRPLGSLETVQAIAATGVTAFSIELMPRTTRAQSMDALSSMATICGYKAVVLAADTAAAASSPCSPRRREPSRRRVSSSSAPAWRASGHCHGAQVGRGGLCLRHAARGQRAGAEPGGPFRGTGRRGPGRPGCARLRAGAGRVVLSAPARIARPRGGGKRCGDHGGGHPRQEGAGAGDAATWWRRWRPAR